MPCSSRIYITIEKTLLRLSPHGRVKRFKTQHRVESKTVSVRFWLINLNIKDIWSDLINKYISRGIAAIKSSVLQKAHAMGVACSSKGPEHPTRAAMEVHTPLEEMNKV